MRAPNSLLAIALVGLGVAFGGCEQLRSPHMDQPNDAEPKAEVEAPKSTFPVSDRYGSVGTANADQAS